MSSVDWEVIAQLVDGLTLADKGRIMEVAILIGGNGGIIPDSDAEIAKRLGIRPCLVTALYRPLINRKMECRGGSLWLCRTLNETSKFERNVKLSTPNVVELSTKRSNLNASRPRIAPLSDPSPATRPGATPGRSSSTSESQNKPPIVPRRLRPTASTRAPKRAPNGAPCAGKPAPGGGISDSVNARFDEFWALYPQCRRTGKGEALKSWRKACGIADADLIIAGLKAIRSHWDQRIAEDEWRFVPMPATWLNQRRWEDDPQVVPEKKAWTPFG